jgi:hypothetical protein
LKISLAGNTEVAAILVLEAVGLQVTSRIVSAIQDMVWTAFRDDEEYFAEDPI